MKTTTFVKLAKSVAANAATYRTKAACGLAVCRVRKAWAANGSYGNLADLRLAAVHACQDRWVELDCLEREARYAEATA